MVLATPSVAVVERQILALLPDADGQWVATLECGHRRHIRHRPPLSSYPWVLDDVERAARIGSTIECERCARLELPADAVAYRTTPEFDEHTLPRGLRAEHDTRAGVWGRIEVLAGQVRFVMPVLAQDRVIEAGGHAIVAPGLVHHVEPLGPARLRVVFLRVPV